MSFYQETFKGQSINTSENAKKHLSSVHSIRLDERMTTSNKNLITPLPLAVRMGFAQSLPIFNLFPKMAKEQQKDIKEVYQEWSKHSTTSNVTSFKLVGPNGHAKTSMVLREAVKFLKQIGKNPRIYSPKKEDGYMMYPESPNDALVVYFHCGDKEEAHVNGLPVATTTDKIYDVDENFEIVKDEDGNPINVAKMGQGRTSVAIFETLARFPYAVLLLDEMNRSPESHMFNSMLNGERGTIEYARYGTIIVATQNSEYDGINLNLTAQDGANITKTSTYLVYMPYKDWMTHITEDAVDIHPAVLAFSQQDNMQRALETPAKSEMHGEIGFPTYRGLENMSKKLFNYEEYIKEFCGSQYHLQNDEIAVIAQANLGRDANYPNLPEEFAEYYIYSHDLVLPMIHQTFEEYTDPMHIGFNDEEFNNQVLSYTFGELNQFTDENSIKFEKFFKKVKPQTKDGGDVKADVFKLMIDSIPYYVADYLNGLINSTHKNIVQASAYFYFQRDLQNNKDFKKSVLNELHAKLNDAQSKSNIFEVEVCNNAISLVETLSQAESSKMLANNKWWLNENYILSEMALNHFLNDPKAHVKLQVYLNAFWQKALKILGGLSNQASKFRMYRELLVSLMQSVRIERYKQLYKGVYYLLLSVNTKVANQSGTLSAPDYDDYREIDNITLDEKMWHLVSNNASNSLLLLARGNPKPIEKTGADDGRKYDYSNSLFYIEARDYIPSKWEENIEIQRKIQSMSYEEAIVKFNPFDNKTNTPMPLHPYNTKTQAPIHKVEYELFMYFLSNLTEFDLNAFNMQFNENDIKDMMVKNKT